MKKLLIAAALVAASCSCFAQKIEKTYNDDVYGPKGSVVISEAPMPDNALWVAGDYLQKAALYKGIAYGSTAAASVCGILGASAEVDKSSDTGLLSSPYYYGAIGFGVASVVTYVIGVYCENKAGAQLKIHAASTGVGLAVSF